MKKEQIQTRNRKTNNKVKKSGITKNELLHPKIEHQQLSQQDACSLGMAPFLHGHFFNVPGGFQQPATYASIDPCHYTQQQPNSHYS